MNQGWESQENKGYRYNTEAQYNSKHQEQPLIIENKMFIYHIVEEPVISWLNVCAKKVYGQDFKINNIIINAFTKIYFLILNHNKSDKHPFFGFQRVLDNHHSPCSNKKNYIYIYLKKIVLILYRMFNSFSTAKQIILGNVSSSVLCRIMDRTKAKLV